MNKEFYNTKNKVIATILCLILVISALPVSVSAIDNDDIVILYENDVHCTVRLILLHTMQKNSKR